MEKIKQEKITIQEQKIKKQNESKAYQKRMKNHKEIVYEQADKKPQNNSKRRVKQRYCYTSD